MVENNEKGLQVRRYFIECERRAKAAVQTEVSWLSPRQSAASAERALIHARAVAKGYRALARMSIYPPEMRAVFAAKSVVTLTGESLTGLLPPVTGDRDRWLPPVEIGRQLGISSNAVGRLLKSLGLHGKDDKTHRHSQPIWNKSQSSNKEIVSYIYDLDIVLPKLSEALRIPLFEPFRRS